jgi:glutamate-1-semialdehyde 2,1-aminomutase
MTGTDRTGTERSLAADAALKERARKVIPGGMFGHQNTARLPATFPQFLARGEGCRIWDVDGNEYVDFMCSYGPIVLGHRHPKVEAAAAAQLARGDTQNGPAPALVELAELLVDTIVHADWALFEKNGTDATTLCCTVARAATGRPKILVAHGAYHGAAPWCTPNPLGTTPEDRANLGHFIYNDIASVEAAFAAAGEGQVAGVMVSPFRHDARFDQELVDPDFARGVRRLCDANGAALMLDDVRAGFRLDLGGSWETVGVQPDLSAFSKAIANGWPLAAVTGTDALRDGARRLFATGSFWCEAAPMAAAIATIDALRDEGAIASMERAGRLLRDGLAEQAQSHGFAVRQTGPVQIPWLSFDGDDDFTLADAWTSAAMERGVYLHPWHNWFVCAAHSPDDVAWALERTDEAFAQVRAIGGAA